MEITEIKPGQVIRFKRFYWHKRWAYMQVTDTDPHGFVMGVAWHAGFRQATHRRVTLWLGSLTRTEPVKGN